MVKNLLKIFLAFREKLNLKKRIICKNFFKKIKM